MPKSILKKSENIYISETERELRGGSSHGINPGGEDSANNGGFRYGEIVYGYGPDGQLMEIHRPPTGSDDESGASYHSHDDGNHRGGGSACNQQYKDRKNSEKGKDDDDIPFKFDASFSALDEYVTCNSDLGGVHDNQNSGEVSMSLANLSSLPSLGASTISTGGSRSLARGMDERRRKGNQYEDDDNEQSGGYHSDEYDNDRREAYRHKEERKSGRKVRETQSAYVPSTNMAAKRRAAERRAKVGMIRDATSFSGDRPAAPATVAVPPPPDLRRARSDDGPSSSSSGRRRSQEQNRARRGSSKGSNRDNSSKGGSKSREPSRSSSGGRGSEQGRKSTTSALVSANAKGGDIFEKYRKKSEQVAIDRSRDSGDESFRSMGEGSYSTANDSFRSARSSASTHRSTAIRSKDGTTSARSLGSTGANGAAPRRRRASSTGRQRDLTIRTLARTSSRRRPSGIASPSAARGSANDSFNPAYSSSRISVSSLSARNRQREALSGGGSTDSCRRIALHGKNRRRSSSNDASSLEEELSGDSLGSIGFSADASALSDRSGASSRTGGSQSLNSSRSEKRAYSSKASRIHIRDALS